MIELKRKQSIISFGHAQEFNLKWLTQVLNLQSAGILVIECQRHTLAVYV